MKNIYLTLLVFAMAIAINGCKKVSEKPVSCGIVTDVDGNKYNTVEIGSQCWMVENLKTTRYRDSSAIGEVEDSTWANRETSAWCYYGGDSTNNATYGKLYNYYAVTDPRNICPVGWHIPSDAEFQVLSDYLGGDAVSGGHLKAISNLWAASNMAADNSSGFTALPAGDRPGYPNSNFFDLENFSYFWSSTSNDSNLAWYRYLYFNDLIFYRDYFFYSKGSGFSVRCVKD